MNAQTLSKLLKSAAILWFIWGLFHLFVGVVFISFLNDGHPNGDFKGIPETLYMNMFGEQSLFATIASLKQHSFNLAWIGIIVTIGSFFVWKKNINAIYVCTVIGGFADLGYFLFIDLPGYAFSPGPEMTYIMATAIVLSTIVYFKSDKFINLNSYAKS